MKRKLVLLLCSMLAVTMLAGCGGTEDKEKEGEKQPAEQTEQPKQDDTDWSAVKVMQDIPVENYVTLGDYKALVPMSQKPVVSDAEVLQYVLEYYGPYALKEGTVAMGDAVAISFVGKKKSDGVAFDGGTGDYNLVIGSGSFIAGFEEGLVGVKVGETVDLDLTFPENYTPELAGVDVVFTVTVNGLYPESLTDEQVAELAIDGVTNDAELRTYVRDLLNNYLAIQYESSLQNEALQLFINICEFKEFPQELLDAYRGIIERPLQTLAKKQGMTMEEYIEQSFGVPADVYFGQYLGDNLKFHLALQALANKEDMNLSDEELDTRLQELATMGGFATVEEYMGETGKEDFRDSLMTNDVILFLIDILKKAQ